MANKYRGEIEAKLNGKSYILCLTLGALAELESQFQVDNLVALTERFEKGHLSAQDMIRILGAGLRGGGNMITDEDVALLQTEQGLTGLIEIVSELLHITFQAPDES